MKRKYINCLIALSVALTVSGCSNSETAQTREAAESGETQAESADNAVTETEVTVAEAQETPRPDWMPEDVKMLPSGLGMVIKNPGDETRATRTTPMTIHYRGRLTDGTVFDSSFERGEPAVFMPAQVIPGFGEGIMNLGKGGVATLYIPSNLGYGPQGTPGGPIGPDANLIFDVEIVDIAQ